MKGCVAGTPAGASTFVVRKRSTMTRKLGRITSWASWSLLLGWAMSSLDAVSAQSWYASPGTYSQPGTATSVSQSSVVSTPAQIQLQLAWLADPATFPLNLSLQTTSAGLTIVGTVPTAKMKQQILDRASQILGTQPLDSMTVVPNMIVHLPGPIAPGVLESRVSDRIAKWFPDRATKIQVHADAQGKVTLWGTVVTREEELMVCRVLHGMVECSCVMSRLSLGVSRPDSPTKSAEVSVWKASDGRPTTNALPMVQPATAAPGPSAPPIKVTAVHPPEPVQQVTWASSAVPAQAVTSAGTPVVPIKSPATPVLLPVPPPVPPARPKLPESPRPTVVASTAMVAPGQPYESVVTVACWVDGSGKPLKSIPFLEGMPSKSSSGGRTVVDIVRVPEAAPGVVATDPVTAPVPLPLPIVAPTANVPNVSAVTSASMPTAKLTLAQIQGLVEKACGKGARNVSVHYLPNGMLEVRLDVSSQPLAEEMFNRIVSIPELGPAQLSVNPTVVP
jgi:hypothetical protein